jgi:hypothetical protein
VVSGLEFRGWRGAGLKGIGFRYEHSGAWGLGLFVAEHQNIHRLAFSLIDAPSLSPSVRAGTLNRQGVVSNIE